MKPRLLHRRLQGRRGIALLLVLVMATLLAAVAVSMVSTLRVDRMASVNYKDSVTARSAIQNVVDDVMRQLPLVNNVNTGCPALLTLNQRPPNNGLYGFGGPDGALSAADRASLLTPETLEYLSPDHRIPSSTVFSSPSWKKLTPGVPSVRYFAVVEDLSGLLDLDGLRMPPPIPGAPPPPAPRAVTGRDCLHAYDINFLQAWQADGGALGAPPTLPVFGSLPFYENTVEIRAFATSQNPGQGKLFSNFSYNPQGTYKDDLRKIDRVDISLYSDILKDPFKAQMDALGFNKKFFRLSGAPVQTQSEVLWDMYKDYTDSDSNPTNPYVANEIAAFVSELFVPIRLESITGTTYTFQINPRMEMHFPWVLSAPSNNYTGSAKFELEFEFIAQGTPPAFPPFKQTVTVDVDPFIERFPRMPSPPKDPRFIMSPVPAPLKSQTIVAPFVATSINIKLQVKAAEVRDSGTVVDEVVDSTSFNLTMNSPSSGKQVFWHAEVLDPRINRVFAGTLPEPSDNPAPPLNLTPWRINTTDAGLTPDQVNSYTSTVLGAAPYLFDDVPVSSALLDYVRNDNMLLVGELGSLPIGAWQTIKLISSGLANDPSAIVAHPVSDYFSATNLIKKASSRGLINPNTLEPKVLEALFYQMPADTYPESIASPDPTAMVIPQAVAALIAAPISRRITAPPPLGGGVSPGYPYLNPSDAFNTPELYRQLRLNATLQPYFSNELRRESIVRNSIELMNTRNQLYQILILVQSLSGDNFPLATEKALVQVWHDAISTKAGGVVAPAPHPYLIRQITYLND